MPLTSPAIASFDIEFSIVDETAFTWATGDWNADGDFSSADLIVALAAGGYEIGPRAGAASVPEATNGVLVAIGCIAIVSIWRRRRCRNCPTESLVQDVWNHSFAITSVGPFHSNVNSMSIDDPLEEPHSEDSAMNPETSIGWLESLKGGGPHATGWGYLVDSYGPFLRAILARKGVRAQAADDVVQNILLVIVRRLPEFERQRTGSFRTWLRSITVNCLRDYWKAERKHHPATCNCDVQGLIDELQDAYSQLSQIWNREHAHHVVGLLLDAVHNDFEPKTLEVFKRLALAKEPVDDVARQFAITPNACFIARSRVMKRLKELSDELFGADDSLDGIGR